MRIPLIAMVSASVFALGCATDAQAPKPSAASDVAATVGSTSITLADVDAQALNRATDDFGGVKLSQALYEARRNAIDTIVGNWLMDQEAKARGIDRQTLIEREITAKIGVPTEAEVTDWYQANPARVQGAPLDQVRAPIRGFLIQERALAAKSDFLSGLKAKTPVKILLDPPREKVASAGRPSRGPAQAPVEIIEFSDFQCPYCLRAYPVLKELLTTYGDRIRLVHRHFPLPNHPNARPAAEAAACATEQGKFWEYHDRLFENQSKLSDADLKQHAAALKLDTEKFTRCFDARKYQQDIDADIAAGKEVGITGTPGFFINGRPLEGAQPLERFKEVIDEELARGRAQ